MLIEDVSDSRPAERAEICEWSEKVDDRVDIFVKLVDYNWASS